MFDLHVKVTEMSITQHVQGMPSSTRRTEMQLLALLSPSLRIEMDIAMTTSPEGTPRKQSFSFSSAPPPSACSSVPSDGLPSVW